MKITICVGSTCHLLGSKRVVDKFKELVSEHHLDDKVELAGKFCMGKCGEGVCVTIDGVTTSIQPENAEKFFNSEVLAKL
ncbi:MAG: (2Fe-2S) ferredoxin domain-containing protein [Clostridia bacterium]|nr:(2Fe-2S) ferredoxin domain-containing protein [Clostridia bacterium]